MHVKEMFNLTDRVAVITGASSGLGVWFANGLGEAGAQLVLAARRLDRLQQLANELTSLGVQCLPIQTDVTVESEVERLMSETISQFGRIDILVNNAGGGAPESSVEELKMEIPKKWFDLNIFGVWRCCKHIGRLMLDQGSGKIINVASILGLRANSLEFDASYCASKGALINFSRELAWEWAPRGIKVHCVAPGYFPTESTAELFSDSGRAKSIIQRIPLGRAGTEDDMKGLIVFLASSASDFLLGHPIIFDGGQLLA
jgi:gluconate 5-dehydrogenase